MDRFLTSTFTLEILFSGLAMTALGFAGAMFPIAEATSDATSATDIERISEARMARFRAWLQPADQSAID
ncbi:MAG: hypothetical protein QM647_18920 [Asticcacaulis sp.]|uniref:hypothetical protein n=1 Tax=Asticcacaulis sp. TaxID=1872648 RepID=UPI0039E5E7A1